MRMDSDLARKFGIVALVGALAPTVCLAQLAPSVPSSAAPSIEAARAESGGLDIGGRFGASLEARGEYTDNFYNQTQDEDSVFGAVVSPKVRYVNSIPRFRFAAEATGDFGFFDSVSNADDYEDASFGVGANWLPNSRNALGFGLKYVRAHDPFGSLRTSASPGEESFKNRNLDVWDSVTADLRYTYGGLGSKIQIETGLIGRTKNYTTNRNDINPALTTRFLDYDQIAGTVTALYAYSPKTYFLAEFVPSHTSFQNVLPTSSVPTLCPVAGTPDNCFDPSSDEQRYRVGVRWKAASKTTADLRVGYLRREFDGAFFKDFDAFDFQTQLIWTPVSTDTFTFELLRASQESYIPGTSFVDNRSYSGNWKHYWTRRLNTSLLLNYVDAAFEGTVRYTNDDGVTEDIARSDDYGSVTATGEYQVSRLIKLFASGKYFERTSNQDRVDFDKTTVFVGIRLEP